MSQPPDPTTALLDAACAGRTPAQMRELIEADIAEAKRLRAIGSHGDIEVQADGMIIRVSTREIIALGEPDPDAPVSWFDPTDYTCGRY